MTTSQAEKSEIPFPPILNMDVPPGNRSGVGVDEWAVLSRHQLNPIQFTKTIEVKQACCARKSLSPCLGTMVYFEAARAFYKTRFIDRCVRIFIVTFSSAYSGPFSDIRRKALMSCYDRDLYYRPMNGVTCQRTTDGRAWGVVE